MQSTGQFRLRTPGPRVSRERIEHSEFRIRQPYFSRTFQECAIQRHSGPLQRVSHAKRRMVCVRGFGRRLRWRRLLKQGRQPRIVLVVTHVRVAGIKTKTPSMQKDSTSNSSSPQESRRGYRCPADQNTLPKPSSFSHTGRFFSFPPRAATNEPLPHSPECRKPSEKPAFWRTRRLQECFN